MRTLVAIALLAACGDSSTSDVPDAEGDASPAIALDPPALPAPPVLTPCPEGWSERMLGDIVVCDPFGEAGPLACPSGLVQPPGEPTCVPLGRPCPAGDWPSELPVSADVRYVRPGATGTGTREAPFGTIGEALESVGAGGLIVLAKGRHIERLAIAKPVTIIGACAAETIVGLPEDPSAIEVVTDVATLEDLTVSGGDDGVIARAGGLLRLVSVVFEGQLDSAVVARGGSTIELSRFVVRTYRDVPARFGIVAVEASTVRAERGRIEGFDQAAVSIQEGAVVTLSDAYVVGSRSDLASSNGVQALEDGHATVERCLLEGTGDAALLADGAELVARDVVVRDTHVRAMETVSGGGVAVQSNGSVRVERVLIERAADIAVASLNGGRRVELEDVVIADTRPSLVDGSARSLSFGIDTSAELDRLRIRGGRTVALLGGGRTTIVRARDVDIRDVEAGHSGVGTVQFERGAVLEGERIRIQRGASSGLVVFALARGAVEDLTVEDTRPDVDGDLGRGVSVQDATLGLNRARLVGNREAALMFTRRSIARVSNVALEDTVASACATTTCSDVPAGLGLAVAGPSRVEVEHFRIARSALCGVLLAEGASLDLHDGEIRENPIGVCLQVDGYDLDRLRDRVVFDNEQQLSATMLPLPESLETIE